jgi:NACHT domain
LNARYNSRNRTRPPCDPGTRQDVLAVINQWISKPSDHAVFLLHGIAGSGKSAIAQSTAELFAAEGKLAASFFFNRQEKERCNTERLIETIAYQLAIFVSTIKQQILKALWQDRSILDSVFEHKLQKLIVDPLQLLPASASPRVIVIDGLDECEDGGQVGRLLSVLSSPRLNPRFPLRFFVTSRPGLPLRAILDNDELAPITSLLDLQTFTVDADIRSFLEQKLLAVRRMRTGVMSGISSSWPPSNELDALVSQSSGLFIFAATAVKFIEDPRAIPQEQLKVVLSGKSNRTTDLDQLYGNVLSTSSHFPEFKLTIGAIILLGTSLTPRSLAQLLRIDLHHLLAVLEGLHSILSIPEDSDAGPVTLYHSSLHDFLTTESRSGDYFIDPIAMNADLAKLCLGCIATLPMFPFPTFRDPIHCWNLIKDHLAGQDPAYRIGIRYACRHWFYHFAEASDHLKRNVLAKDLRKLLYYHLIPWRIFLAIDIPREPWGRFDDVQIQVQQTGFGVQLYADQFDHTKTLTFWDRIRVQILVHRTMPLLVLIMKRNQLGVHPIVSWFIVIFACLGLFIPLVWSAVWMLEKWLVKELEQELVRQREVERCVHFEHVWIKVCRLSLPLFLLLNTLRFTKCRRCLHSGISWAV